MDKEVLSFVVEKTHELMNAASCSKEAKASAQTWLDAVGTENEAAATKTYIAELEADIMPVDGLIGFAESEMGAQVFGADKAKEVAAHATDTSVGNWQNERQVTKARAKKETKQRPPYGKRHWLYLFRRDLRMLQ